MRAVVWYNAMGLPERALLFRESGLKLRVWTCSEQWSMHNAVNACGLMCVCVWWRKSEVLITTPVLRLKTRLFYGTPAKT